MTIADRREAADLAASLLRISPQDAYTYSSDVPEIDGFFVWQPIRGGAQLLVGRDGGVLFGISALTREQLVASYLEGTRTDRAAFNR